MLGIGVIDNLLLLYSNRLSDKQRKVFNYPICPILLSTPLFLKNSKVFKRYGVLNT